MSKFLVSIIGALAVFSAFAAGENIPTTKSYVDNALSSKQDIIEHTTGANQVLTNTGVVGEYGTKEIYDSTSTYSAQMDALVDAQTMNAAVQNAIDSEFQCIEWEDPNDHTSDCLLMEIRGATENVSPNVFDSSQILSASGWTESNGVYSGRIKKLYDLGRMNACNPSCEENTRYTLSYTITIDENAQPSGTMQAGLYITYTDGTKKVPSYADRPDYAGETAHVVLVSDANKTIRSMYATFGYDGKVHISNIQLEKGTRATPYQPYGANIYLPSGN